MDLNNDGAIDALARGDALEYRRTPHTDWMRCPHGHQFNAHFYYRTVGEKTMMTINITLKVPDDSTAAYIHGSFCFAAEKVLQKINRDGRQKVDQEDELPMPHGDSATFFRVE
jgi:hypothetical protein